MKQQPRPRLAGGLGMSSSMPADTYEHRTKPVRNRVRPASAKVKGNKPRAHRVGRSKR